jgi:hypothetical protein
MGFWILTTCNLSCQNSFSFALSRNGNSRTWCTKMYRKIGRSESRGEISPKSDLNGAPNLCSAVGELSSMISYLTCWEMSSRFKSEDCQWLFLEVLILFNLQCSCLPVSTWPELAAIEPFSFAPTGNVSFCAIVAVPLMTSTFKLICCSYKAPHVEKTSQKRISNVDVDARRGSRDWSSNDQISAEWGSFVA